MRRPVRSGMEKVKRGLRRAAGFIHDVVADFSRDNCPLIAGAIAYFVAFSLPPLLVFILLLVGAVITPQAAQGAIYEEMRKLLGTQSAEQIREQVGTMIEKANPFSADASTLALALGIAALLFSVSGAFWSLQVALNTAWKVQPDPRHGFRNFFFPRLLSLGLVVAIAFLLLVSLLVSALLTAFGDFLAGFLPGGITSHLLRAGDWAVSFGVITVLFAAILKVLPDARIGWQDVWLGAAFTALLFVAGKSLLSLFIAHSNPVSAFGAAGSFALILLWIYISSVILLFGAEFTQVWARYRGKAVRPIPGAMRVRQELIRVDEAGNPVPESAVPPGKR